MAKLIIKTKPSNTKKDLYLNRDIHRQNKKLRKINLFLSIVTVSIIGYLVYLYKI